VVGLEWFCCCVEYLFSDESGGSDVEEEGAPEGEGDSYEGGDVVGVVHGEGEEGEAEGEEEVCYPSLGLPL